MLFNPVTKVLRPMVMGTVASNKPKVLQLTFPLLLAALLILVFVSGAFAAEADWTAPVNEAASTFRTGLTEVVVALGGLMIAIAGITIIFQGRIDLVKLLTIVFGLLIVFAGPPLLEAIRDVIGK